MSIPVKVIVGGVKQVATIGGVSVAEKRLQAEIDELKADNDRLWKISEGITYELTSQAERGTNNPPAKAMFAQVEEVHGESRQTQLSGKNLLDFGHPAIVGKYLLSDGSEVNGQAYANAISDYIPVSPNVAYTISGVSEANTSAWCWYDENKNFINGQAYQRHQSRTIVMPSNARYIRVSLTVAFPTQMVEQGSVATAYEPYVGGIPSPSPQYPQAITDVVNPKVTVKDNALASAKLYSFNISGTYRYGYKVLATPDMVISCNGVGDRYYNINLYDMLDHTANTCAAVKTMSLRESANETYIYRTYTPDVEKWVAIIYGAGVDEAIADEEMKIAKLRADVVASETTIPITLRGIGDVHDVLMMNESGEAEVERNIGVRNVVPSSMTANFNAQYGIAYASAQWSGHMNNTAICTVICPVALGVARSKWSVNTDKWCCYGSNGDSRFYINSMPNLYDSSNYNNLKSDLMALSPVIPVAYCLATPVIEPHPELTPLLKSLVGIPVTSSITVTDESGVDVPWLAQYIVSLRQ